MIDFEGINQAAVRAYRSVLPSLIPGGKFRGQEYVVKNPCRDDQQAGSFKVNIRGVWKDFATGEGGSDFISLWAWVRGIRQGEAARELADKLGLPLHKPNGATTLTNGASRGNNAAAPLPEPKIVSGSENLPPLQSDELRRHIYPGGDGIAVKVKIKLRDGSYTQRYRVEDGWHARKPDDFQSVPYVTEAINPFDPELKDDQIFWPEGEKDVDTFSKLNLPAFTFGGTGDGLPDGIDEYLASRNLIILVDNDDPGRFHAEKKAERAHAVGAASIRIVYFPELQPKGDVSDFMANGGTAEQLVDRATRALLWRPDASASNGQLDAETVIDDRSETGAEVERLAKLDRIEYGRARKGAAKRLGVSVGALDEEVKEHRKQHKEESTSSAWAHWNVEPWAESVDSGRLFQALTERIRKHVVVTANQAVVVALWVMFTWVHDKAAVHSPILLVTSPEPNCGKSTLLGVIGYLVSRSLVSVSIKGPALFRSIEKWHPTFVIDEADTALVNNDDLKEVVNSGWTRGQSVVRCDPETYDPRPFSTFAPKAIGMKGRNLPDATLSRAIIVELRRKLPADQVRDFAHVDDASFAELRRMLQRWADDNGTKLASAEVTIPDSFHNRVRANWKLLLAIAELAGAADKARQAAIAIEDIKATFDASIGVELLHDIGTVFEGHDVLFTRTLIAKLVDEEERPWAAYGRAGVPITDRQVAKLLGSFGIISTSVRIGEATAKGYRRADFADAWTRYPKPALRPDDEGDGPTPDGGFQPDETSSPKPKSALRASQRHNPTAAGTSRIFSSVTEPVCDAQETPELSNNDGHCDGVTVATPPWRRTRSIRFEERAAILEYEGGLQRAEAEKIARLELAGSRTPARCGADGDGLDDLEPGP